MSPRNSAPQKPLPVVIEGQRWADNDKRIAKHQRELYVLLVANGKATCSIWMLGKNTGRQTSVSIARFRPISTGYRLIAGPGFTA